MANRDLNVNVTVTTNAPASTKKGFGTVLGMTEDVTFSEDYKIFEDNNSAQNDSELGINAKDIAAEFFGQKKHPPKLMIGKKAADQAMVDTITVGGTWADGDILACTVTPFDGSAIEASYTASGGSETPDTMAAGLRADLTTKLAAEDITVGGSTNLATLTADNAGEPFVAVVSVTSSAGTATLAHTTANINYATELAALFTAIPQGVDTPFGIAIDSRDKADIQYTAIWANAEAVVFGGQTSDADVLTATAGNIAAWLKSKSYGHTFLSWHADDGERKDVAWLADWLSADPDVTATTAAYRHLQGITVNAETDVDATAKANIDAQYCNVYLTFNGVAVTGTGILCDGSWMESLVTEMWLKFRIDEDVSQLLLDRAARNEKIPYTQDGINSVEDTVEGRLGNGEGIGHLAPPDENTPAYVLNHVKIGDVTTAKKQAKEFDLTGTAYKSGSMEKINISIHALIS